MEIIIQLFDELDDVFGPMLAMATAVDCWRAVAIACAAVAALAHGSAVIFGAGLLLAAAGDLLPRRGSQLRPANLPAVGRS